VVVTTVFAMSATSWKANVASFSAYCSGSLSDCWRGTAPGSRGDAAPRSSGLRRATNGRRGRSCRPCRRHRRRRSHSEPENAGRRHSALTSPHCGCQPQRVVALRLAPTLTGDERTCNTFVQCAKNRRGWRVVEAASEPRDHAAVGSMAEPEMIPVGGAKQWRRSTKSYGSFFGRSSSPGCQASSA